MVLYACITELGEIIYYKETAINMQITRMGQACDWVG